MRLVAISDIHINEHDDNGLTCFRNFSTHALVKDATHIALMGDIFDLVAGNHHEYDKRWEEVFKIIKSFCEQGKVVYFAEGNHDMHLKRLLSRISSGWHSHATHLVHIEDYLVIDFLGKKVHLSHGDELNVHDVTYLKYKKFIKKFPMGLIADFILPISVLDYLGHKASKKSRKYGSTRFNEEDVRFKFREGLSKYFNTGIDIVVGGHSHVTDNYLNGNLTYLNNGYPPKSNKFIVIDNEGPRLETLV
ncbi:MAG: metallophosphoesterase [Proteobacteria bacterium]|nr:metallophosphoesterase [Pseudomonadota bacterium]